MDKLTAIKIKYDDGTYSDEIPVSVLSENVEWDSTHTLVDVLGSIDVDVTGTIQDQISQLFNEKINYSAMESYVSNNMNTYITAWLNNNVDPTGSVVMIDKTLSIEDSAADAKTTGDSLSDFKKGLMNLSIKYGNNIFNPFEIIPNCFLSSSTGEVENNKIYDSSDFIAIQNTYLSCRIFNYTGSVSLRIYFYNSNKSFLSRSTMNPSIYPNGTVFQVPSSAYYIRICVENHYNSSGYIDIYSLMIVNDNLTLSTYIPYYSANDRESRDLITNLKNICLTYESNSSNTDANNLSKYIGYYYLSGRSVANLPNNTHAWYLWQVRLNSSNLLQLAYEAHGTKPYLRAKVQGSWGNWEQFGK